MKKVWIILLILVATALVAFAVYKYFNQANSVTLIKVEEDIEETNGLMYLEDLDLDTMMLGKWQHVSDTGWYRTYTMEPAGDGYYWGREWNTTEDITEEDLIPYGNGWFKWKKEGNEVIEIHMTDNHIAAIPHEYKMLKLSNQEMRYKEAADADRQQFNKVQLN